MDTNATNRMLPLLDEAGVQRELAKLQLDARFTRELPGDPRNDPHTRQVFGACYSFVQPTPVASPRTLATSREVIAALGLSEAFVASPAFAQVFSGNRLLPGTRPWAQCYGGHQFGNWAGQLGDGRAISLTELIAPSGKRWELQLKGAGPTPYSRHADGRAVLRSSIREFLCSEAMHALGVPTTRALSLVATGEDVVRDMLYDGNPRPEPGAIVCRVAPSFLRFGSYEIHTSRGDHTTLRTLVDHTLRAYFPELGAYAPAVVPELLRSVGMRTIRLVSEWMRVGFVHGVLNTDNMSVLGLTIDYGPYGWVDDFNPDWTPNTTDAHGRRYRFGNQPAVVLWNLAQFANALYPLVGDAAPFERVLLDLREHLGRELDQMRNRKLGLGKVRAGDAERCDALDQLLHAVETDYTLFYRHLAQVNPDERPLDEVTDAELVAPLETAFYRPAQVSEGHRHRLALWLRDWLHRAAEEGVPVAARAKAMNDVNPRYVLRNYLAHQAIERAEAGDSSEVHRLLDILRRPYERQPDRDDYAAKRPDWARDKAGASMLSCSS